MIPTRPPNLFRRLVVAGALVAVAGCASSSRQATGAAGAAGTTVAAPTQPAPNTPAGDPCAVIPIPTLEQITGLSGLTVTSSTKFGCFWNAGTSGVSYSVQQIGTQDLSKKVDLGHGHDGVVQEAARGVGNIDLRLPPDRLVGITVSVAESSDVGTIILNLGKAFSAVSDKLPALTKQ